jgi:integrase
MDVYKVPGSKKWHYGFTFNGHRVQKSSRVENRKEAEGIASAAWTQLARGEVGLEDKPRFSEEQLLDRLKQRWQLEGKATVQNLSLLKKVKADFGTKMADALTAQDLERYALRRRKEKYANATTNRIFQCLRRAHSLAGVPWSKFELLPEHNRRMGFFSAEQMEKVLGNLPDDGLRDFVRFCWATGMRKGEASELRWSFLQDGQIIVPPEICKSRKPHVIPVAGPLAAIIEARKSSRAFKVMDTTQLSEFIFHRGDGLSITEFRKSWKTACTKAGCGNMLFHDLRRSFCRDAIRGGTPQSVCMALSGHRTIATFLRYDISADEDKRQGLEKTASYRAG